MICCQKLFSCKKIEPNLFVIYYYIIPWKNSVEMLRKLEVILNDFRIGHTQIEHSYLMSKDEPPICTASELQSIKRIPIKDVDTKIPELSIISLKIWPYH